VHGFVRDRSWALIYCNRTIACRMIKGPWRLATRDSSIWIIFDLTNTWIINLHHVGLGLVAILNKPAARSQTMPCLSARSER